MTVAMRTDKCCAASGRALQVESAASKMQRVKIHLRKTLQNRSKYMDENKFATMNSLHKDSLYTKIRDIMRNNNFLTLKGCKEKLENEISVAQLSKEIKKAGLSKKQIKKRSIVVLNDRNIDKRQAFCSVMLGKILKRVVLLDESGFPSYVYKLWLFTGFSRCR